MFVLVSLVVPQVSVAQLKFKHLTINEGLSQNVVLCMLQDREGYIWMGTEDGLNRYDGYEFKHYKHSDDENSISNSFINGIVEDKNGNFWIATADGLNLYDKHTDRFTRIETISKESRKLNRDFINSILLDGENLWIGTIEGVKRYHISEKKIFQITANVKRQAINLDNRTQGIFKDGKGTLWVGTTGGLQCYEAISGKPIHLPQSLALLENLYVRVIKKDLFGRLWLGSESNGVFIYDSKKDECISCNAQNSILPGVTIRDVFFRSKDEVWIGTIQGLNVRTSTAVKNYAYRPEDDMGLNHNSIRCILGDRAGNVWLGTYSGGVNVYYKDGRKFQLITERSSNRDGLNHPVVSSMVEDDKHNLWIGTEGGGLNFYDATKGFFQTYKVNELKSIPDNIIKSVIRADDKHLWIGTYNGLRLFNVVSRTFTGYPQVSDKAVNGSKQIYALLRVDSGLWIGTNGGGLRFLSKEGELKVFSYHPKDPHSISSNNINAVVPDKKGNLWVATQKGLNYFDTKTQKSKPFYLNSKDKRSLSNNLVFSVFVDSRERVWVGTDGGGLNVFQNNKFYRITEEQGIGNNVVHAINEDNEGNIWISTNKGLSRIFLKTVHFSYDNLKISNYSIEDGLQSNQFATGATIRTQDGTLYFGGIKGITSFYPSEIKTNLLKPDIVFTDILIRDKKLVDSKEGQREKDVIVLTYDHGSITFKFSALNFLVPQKNKYAYRLEGLSNDEDWHYVNADQRLATYTNLAAGTYYFRLKAANNDEVWNNQEKVIKIQVLPPFWKTWWAYLIYFVIVVVILYLFYYYSLKTAKLKNELYFEHLSHVKDQELAEQKINFFTNISHEIKTPLTLILSPLDSIIKTSRSNNKVKPQLLLMQRNGERLNRLINQLLDFRKFESGHMLAKNTENDLVKFLEEICVVFESHAAQQNIKLVFQSDYHQLFLWYDEDKLEKIMYNLLSNAVKFSTAGGEIKVRLRKKESDNKFIGIDVEDNGIGITQNQLDSIFDQFQYNDDNNRNSTGTGIGLAFSRGLAELLGGTLTVQSKARTGKRSGYTCFTINLPLIEEGYANEIKENVNVEEEEYVELIDAPMEAKKKVQGNLTLLIVEDNVDLLGFMLSSFSDRFMVHTATNGKEALEKLTAISPDLIISDVMMPEMNGIEFCKRVKADALISHIPLILLTARTPAMYKIEGFEIGADDYITKPFHIDVLEARIINLIESRKKIIAKYKTEMALQPQNVDITSPDEVFLSKIMMFIENNLSEPGLNVEDMAKEVGMARSALYRKIKSMTGKTAIEFIRSVRIKRAGQMLKQKKLTVKEVVYSVGFTDMDYFRKCFKEEFGMTPRDYVNSEEV
ncbi:hybrid sensor histidine kinase/response regulator transcription factor [Pseudopedobacter beijingensis]|uniref:histidine kinase n=1 Tax=Pseudopedobacter beijingensis TaxID=1207056 RepID=A0ABW4IB23_9SPHI